MREGTELFYEAKVSIAQAALGTRITVPTVDGEEEVEIKPGTQPDTEIRLRGKGVPAPPAGRPARRPPRPGRRRRADQAVEEGSASCSAAYAEECRRGGRRRAAAGCSRSSGWVERRRRPAARPGAWLELVGRGRRRGGRGRQRDPRPGGARRDVGRARLRARRRGPRRPGRPDPAGDRPRLPARPRPARPRTAPPPRCRAALGHLQAFGLRPIGELRTRLVHEADWADAWKAHFPVMRIGRRLVIRPTWRRHRRGAGRRRPGARSGDGLRDRAPPDDAAVPGRRSRRSPTAGVLAGARASSTSAAARGSWRSPRSSSGRPRALGVDTDPIAIEATVANARRNRLGRRLARPRGQPAERRAARSTSCSRTSSPGVLVAARRRAPRRAATGRHARSRRASSSTARRRSARRSRRPGSGRRAAGRRRVGRARGRPAGPDRVAAPYNRGDAVATSRSCSSPTSSWRSACSCPSILLPFALRTRRADGRVGQPRRPGAALGADATARSSIGLGLALTGLGSSPSLGLVDARAAVAARWR